MPNSPQGAHCDCCIQKQARSLHERIGALEDLTGVSLPPAPPTFPEQPIHDAAFERPDGLISDGWMALD